MPKTVKTPLPDHSRLWPRVVKNDFLDGYAVDSPLPPQQAADIGLSMPGWANALLGLRNMIVKPLGLKTDVANSGDGAIFPIESQDETEIILGTDDKHLNFRISVMQVDGRVYMGTWVHPHNTLGRAYLAAVMPFHILIVRNAMRRIARAPIAPRAMAQ
ncbi:MAG: DUF2867 domain-containing protein [Paracoccaceae bacterium]